MGLDNSRASTTFAGPSTDRPVKRKAQCQGDTMVFYLMQWADNIDLQNPRVLSSIWPSSPPWNVAHTLTAGTPWLPTGMLKVFLRWWTKQKRGTVQYHVHALEELATAYCAKTGAAPADLSDARDFINTVLRREFDLGDDPIVIVDDLQLPEPSPAKKAKPARPRQARAIITRPSRQDTGTAAVYTAAIVPLSSGPIPAALVIPPAPLAAFVRPPSFFNKNSPQIATVTSPEVDSEIATRSSPTPDDIIMAEPADSHEAMDVEMSAPTSDGTPSQVQAFDHAAFAQLPFAAAEQFATIATRPQDHADVACDFDAASDIDRDDEDRPRLDTLAEFLAACEPQPRKARKNRKRMAKGSAILVQPELPNSSVSDSALLADPLPNCPPPPGCEILMAPRMPPTAEFWTKRKKDSNKSKKNNSKAKATQSRE